MHLQICIASIQDVLFKTLYYMDGFKAKWLLQAIVYWIHEMWRKHEHSGIMVTYVHYYELRGTRWTCNRHQCDFLASASNWRIKLMHLRIISIKIHFKVTTVWRIINEQNPYKKNLTKIKNISDHFIYI